ncbi:MAG: FAD:protein FMN transferase [Alistipes sp.]|jgi:thiamine biosynthesis lipoprotein|nr:FAD:protein FMN transferase [Alistipes sp.]
MKRLTAFFALLTTACTGSNYVTFSGPTQGTTYNIVVNNPTPETEKKIDTIFAEIDQTFSIFNPQSLTSRINRGETDATTPLFEECFALAKRVHKQTGGYFDSTVAPLVNAWGFGSEASQEIPCVECIMEHVGMDKVRIEGGRLIKEHRRVQLDFGSIAKGFSVDRLAEMLDGDGISDYMVWVGGEVRARGVNESGRPWRFGINEPTLGFSNDYGAVVSFEKGGGSGRKSRNVSHELRALATSGNYRNWFVDGSGRTRVHTIDPLTGYPVQGQILSVSIVSAECALADAWATGVMASGSLEKAVAMLERAASAAAANDTPPIEYYIIYGAPENSTSPENPESTATKTIHSPGFPLIEKP